MKMNVVRITAAAQVTLSVLFLAAYFFILLLYVLGYAQVATVWRDQVGVLLGVLTGGVASVVGFWFNRQRHQRKDEEGAESVDYVIGDGRPGVEVPETVSPVPAGGAGGVGLGNVEGPRWVQAWIRGSGIGVSGGGDAGQREVHGRAGCTRCGCCRCPGPGGRGGQVADEGPDGLSTGGEQ